MQNGWIDLRSDTVTHPTPAMRTAMAEAPVGDDVYGDDPTVNALEEDGARLLGKAAALFVPSGTMGNQLALMTWVSRGDEVILGDACHIVAHEAGAAAILAGAQLRCLPAPDGRLSPPEVRRAIRTQDDIHQPRTGLLCLENAHSSGSAIPLDEMEALCSLVHGFGIPVHLDGARLFNAAEVLGVAPADLSGPADSVMVCLSKGLCAPVGSLLCGSRDFVRRARRNRKILGGGMRQAGILAAAGRIALRDMTRRLGEDHRAAADLAGALAAIPGLEVLPAPFRINMVFFRSDGLGLSDQALMDRLASAGILANPPEDGIMRLVTHYWVTPEDLRRTVEVFRSLSA